MTTPCSDFRENAWRKDLCVNCQRSRSEHAYTEEPLVSSSPVPAKRSSIVGKFATLDRDKKKKTDKASDWSKSKDDSDWPENDSEWCMIDGDEEKKKKENNVDGCPSSSIGTVTVNEKFSKPDGTCLRNSNSVSKNLKVSFANKVPVVIGEDGGWCNLLEDDNEDDDEEDETPLDNLSFTEEERDFILKALENTLWNSDNNNLLQKTVDTVALRKRNSGEFEDLNKLSLWQPDRFSTLRDCDKLLPSRFGTFPGRSKSSKTNMEPLCDNEGSAPSLTELQQDQQDLNDKLGSLENIKFTITNKDDNLTCNEKFHELFISKDFGFGDSSDSKFEDDITDDTDLFASFKTDIDLDASTAGDELVDLLNDVLAKYSSDGDSFKGIEGHELLPDFSKDEMKQVVEAVEEGDGKFTKGSIKSKEFEQKLVSLAKTLDLNKKKTKKAPRPPSSPPPPEPISPKPSNTINLPEPKFKMITVGKGILDQGQEKPLSPKRNTEFGLEASSDVPQNGKSQKVDKSKKGIASFFKSFLKRGSKESIDSPTEDTESGENVSITGSSCASLQSALSAESTGKSDLQQTSPLNTRKNDSNPCPSPSMKPKVLSAKPPKSSSVLSATEEKSHESENSSATNSETSTKKKEKESPKVRRASMDKISHKKKEKESPKPRRASFGSSPKNKRKDFLPSSSEVNVLPVAEESNESSTDPIEGDKAEAHQNDHDKPQVVKRSSSDKVAPTTSAKPPVTARPKPATLPSKPTNLLKSSSSSSSSASLPKGSSSGLDKQLHAEMKERSASLGSASSLDGAKNEKKPDHPGRSRTKDGSNQARKRPKSPKRTAAPTRPNHPPKVMEGKNLFTKELEKKISKSLENKAPPPCPPPAPPASSPVASSSQAPPPKTDGKKSAPQAPCSPTTATTTIDLSVPNAMTMSFCSATSSVPNMSLSGPMSASFTSATLLETKTDTVEHTDHSSSVSTNSSTATATSSTFTNSAEKIELPRAQGKKGFLGKLGSRKTKAPPRPPSIVKRTKSITEHNLLGECQMKKIDVSDISSPVLITEMTSSQVVSRRNTISIGEDCSFVSGGSTSSGSTANDKYDEWPQFSPLGSIENLYEPIVPKEPPPPPPEGGPMYDPVSSTQSNQVSQPCEVGQGPEGYLEPVRSTPPIEQQAKEVIVPEEILEQPDISEERRRLLATQPIYEEINGYGKDTDEELESYGVNNNGELGNNLDQPDALESDAVTMQNKASEMDFKNLNVDVSSQLDKDLDLSMSPSPSQDSGSSSACSTLNRPKPIPRRRSSRKIDSLVGDQPYIAMNRPSIAVALFENDLRDILSQMTALNLQTMREIYTQYEKEFIREPISFDVTGSGPIKFADFDIYGKPVHASERCIVYNAKYKATGVSCQIMILQTRPDLTNIQHSSLLKPMMTFSDLIPFLYLTKDFITTNQLLQNLQSFGNRSTNEARCHIAVGSFDICGGLNHKLSTMRENISCQTGTVSVSEYLDALLFYILQLLSAISHCLDNGYTLGEANFRDVFILTNSNYSHGDVIAFLPQQQLHDSSQVELVCALLERYFTDALAVVKSNSVDRRYACLRVIVKMLQTRRLECLAHVRGYTEYLLWGPKNEKWRTEIDRQSNIEPKISMWIEKERTTLIHKFACIPVGSVRTCSVQDFYQMKFLLKSCAVSMTECIRHHLAYSSK